MAVSSGDKDALRYLRALGMPERCIKFTVVCELNDVIRAEATFFPEGKFDEPITKRFVLAESEDEK
jgi:hypothetical protein